MIMSSSDKRKQARCQGSGWNPKTKSVRSDRDKDELPQPPAWMCKNVDCVTKEKPVFEQPEDPVRVKPPEREIKKAGVYDLSTEPSGISRIRYFPDFLSPFECGSLYDKLYDEMPWTQRHRNIRGETVHEPRLTAWVGEASYTYSGITWDNNPNWTPTLLGIRERIEDVTGYVFNSVLGNLYRDCKDSVDWHSDDEPSLGPEPVIASISLGDTRIFEMRKKPGYFDNGDYSFVQHIKMPLTNGSLLIMEGCTQADWQHRVPKEYHDRKPRINLTFRTTYS